MSTHNSSIDRPAHRRIVEAMDVEGMRVLDLGCGSGEWSVLLAAKASEVVGLDHRANAVASASESASRRGAGNCRFVRADFRDEDLHAALGSFDAVTAFGVLHRVPDVFSFFDFAAKFAPRIVVEWRAPIFPMMQRFAIAAHSEKEFIDGSNLGPRAKGSDIESYGSYGFWDVSTRAAQVIAARAGFVRSALWGFARYRAETLSSPRSAMMEWASLTARDVVRKGLGNGFRTKMLSPSHNFRAYMSLAMSDAAPVESLAA